MVILELMVNQYQCLFFYWRKWKKKINANNIVYHNHLTALTLECKILVGLGLDTLGWNIYRSIIGPEFLTWTCKSCTWFLEFKPSLVHSFIRKADFMYGYAYVLMGFDNWLTRACWWLPSLSPSLLRYFQIALAFSFDP